MMARVRLAVELVVYNLVLAVFMPVLVAWVAWRLVARGKPIGSWRDRFGMVRRLPGGRRPRIWVHAVSAGEMGAAQPVVKALREVFPGAGIGVSTQTAAGMAVAKRSVEGADSLFYLPFEAPDCMGLALWRLRPDLVVVTEKELWPNLLGLARLAGARVLVVNGRVSDRMMRRAKCAPGAVSWLCRLPDRLCVQSEEDERRLRRLGVPRERVSVAGNTKADTLARRDREAEARLAGDLGAGEGEVWLVAGSTHPGEEEQVVEAFGAIQREIASARLLLAPRHLERVAAVSAALAQRGIQVVRRSDGEAPKRRDAVVILDTMGELRAAYGLGTAGVVGGTLAPIGGHYLLEPVAAGRAALFGPHTANCEDVADLVLAAGVGFRTGDAEELAEAFLRIAQ
ncbi:MAG: 3-deoxy-D-manno-octulosonic acid transferase, partial [Armatimonadetes bacterium]|nr:3-deoxy-D-manno-octulosonic acid transferase [Armatimonadota bacterium]